MKSLLTMTVFLIMLVASMASRAHTEDIKGFIGLWEAVDGDGSHTILSITDNGSGIVKLLVFDTHFSRCNGGRGLGQGTGEVLSEIAFKAADVAVTCFETGETTHLAFEYIRNPDGTLKENNLDDPSVTPNIYHRTSK